MGSRRPRSQAIPRRPGTLASAALLLAALAAVAPWIGIPPAYAAPAAFGVELTASPSSGSAPLEVSFVAAVSSGTPTQYNWSFGDGSTLNGTGSTYADPVHTFARAGDYRVDVVVWEGAGRGNGSRTVLVAEGPLAVSIDASPTSGVAPLTVLLQANVSGGTGTYVQFNWQLGDGGGGVGPLVANTYRIPGAYRITVYVTDSAGNLSEGELTLEVRSAPVPPPLGLSPVMLLEVALVGAIGVGAATMASVRRWGRPPPPGPEDSMVSPRHPFEPPESSTAGTTAPAPAASAISAPPPTVGPPAASREPSRIPGAGRATDPTLDRAAADLRERRRLSRRVVVRLSELGRLGSEEIPDSRWTQRGIGDALGASQNRVSNVLRRLAAAGVLVEEVRHVSGRPRRVKVYRLSARGEALGRSYRSMGRPDPKDRESGSGS
jgi:DNA-binding MarR family transcriptional regulator